ncbi:CBO0543 family protein [Aneurinibacillus migulanus]
MVRSSMTIVKHWRKSSLQLWHKKRSFPPQRNRQNSIQKYVPAMIFSSWLGTYADLIMVEQQMYSFPIRPFPALFSINIAFTVFLLPITTAFFLYYVEKLNTTQRFIVVLLLGFFMPLVEQLSEKVGWFNHSSEWRHLYSFFGYIFFMWLVCKFHFWYSYNNRIPRH